MILKSQQNRIELVTRPDLNQAHDGIFFECQHCDEKISGEGNWKKLTPFKKLQRARRNLNMHLLTEHGLRLEGRSGYVCAFDTSCNFRTSLTESMRDHVRIQHYNLLGVWSLKMSHSKLSQCPECGKMLRGHRMRDHMNIEHNPDFKNEFLCPDCGKAFPTRESLTRHSRVHQEPTERCPLCPMEVGETRKRKVLYTKRKLKKHILEVHDKSRKCPNCPYSTYKKETMRDHFRIKHLKYLRWQCSQCSSLFSKSSNARAHFQNVHLKNMDRRVDQEYFAKHPEAVIDKKKTDQEYPSDEHVDKIIEEATSIS